MVLPRAKNGLTVARHTSRGWRHSNPVRPLDPSRRVRRGHAGPRIARPRGSPEAASCKPLARINLVRGELTMPGQRGRRRLLPHSSRAIFVPHGERSDPGKGSRRVGEAPRRLTPASCLSSSSSSAPFRHPSGPFPTSPLVPKPGREGLTF
jgi:hypothetical protein